MKHPFTPEEIKILGTTERRIDIYKCEPDIEKIADSIYSREVGRDCPRTRGMVNAHTFSGFGAEHALMSMIPGMKQNNTGVVKLEKSSKAYRKLQKDLTFRDYNFAVKSADENQEKNRGLWWIAKSQHDSLLKSLPFNEFLIVVGFMQSQKYASNFVYRPMFLIDYRAFMASFDKYTETNSSWYSRKFKSGLAIKDGICLDLRNVS